MPISALIVIDTGNGFNAAYYSMFADTLTAAGIDVETAFMGSALAGVVRCALD